MHILFECCIILTMVDIPGNVQNENICLPESNSPYVGFVGQNVTMPCTGYESRHNDFNKRARWYHKCHKCVAEWFGVAELAMIPGKTKSVYAKDRRSISPSTGALTILNFQRNDEGTYKCDFFGTGKYLVELKSACEFAVLLLYQVHHRINIESFVLRSHFLRD